MGIPLPSRGEAETFGQSRSIGVFSFTSNPYIASDNISLIRATMSVYADISVNPSPSSASATMEATLINNQALQAEHQGDLAGAEQLHLRAIEIKERGIGANAVSTALSRNALGELYMKMGRLDEAETNLKKAIQVRNSAGPAFDAAVSRENLAQLYEMRGKLKEAKEARLYGAPNNLSCGYYHCPGQLFKFGQMSQCGRCKAVYYCSKSCQTNDWKSRHKQYCKSASE